MTSASASLAGAEPVSDERPLGQKPLDSSQLAQLGAQAEAQAGESPYQIPEITGEETELRTESVKHFRCADGSSVAVDYGYPVHFKRSLDSPWEQRDYSLVDAGQTARDGTKEYSLKAAPDKITVAATAKSAQILSAQVAGHSLSWGYAGIAATKAEVANGQAAISRDSAKLSSIRSEVIASDISTTTPKLAAKSGAQSPAQAETTKPEALTGNDKFLTLTSLTSSSYYADIYDSVDVDYVIGPLGVKDNLILKSPQAQHEFISDYDIGDLTARQTDSKTIDLMDETGSVVATLSAPYMTDSADDISYDLTLSIVNNSSGKLSVKLSADKTWLTSKDRAYPVVIDPMLQSVQTTYQQAYVASGQPSTAHPYGDMYVGYDGNAYKIARGYLRFDFPTIPTGSIVLEANLAMYQYSYSAVPSNTTATTYTLHPVTDTTWTANTLTWNNKPGYTSTVSDYAITSSAKNANYLTFDVTRLVKDTLETSTASTKKLSVMLKGKNETTTSPYANVRLLTANYPGLPSGAKPFIYFFYRDSKGLEDYWSYTTISAGDAGTASVNDYTGNLVFEHADAATTGLRMPVALSSVYNSDISDGYRPGGASGEIRHGRGWKLSLICRVQTTAAVGFAGDTTVYPYVYTDADGTLHYFRKDGTKITDEDGLNLELAKLTSGYSITDKKGGVMTFDADGYLTQIKDANGNAATISYVSGSHRLSQVKDGIGHIISFDAPLNSAGNAYYLSKITDPAGRVTGYSCDSNGRLVQIKYPDATLSKYEYNAKGQLYRAYSSDGTGAEFIYKSDGSVSRIREYGGTPTNPMSSPGLTYRFDRSKYCATTIESPGADGVLSLTDGDTRNDDNVFTTLQFDTWGHTVSSIAKVGSTTLGAGTSSYTKGSNDSTSDTAKRNRLINSATLAKNSVNLCANPGAEAALGSEWTSLLYGTSATFSFARTSADKYQGNYSLKLTSTAAGTTSAARAYQAFSTTDVKGGYTYTFSADVKAAGITPVQGSVSSKAGAVLLLYAYSPTGNTYTFSEYLSGTTDSATDSGWRRLYATLKMPDDTTSVRANLMIYSATGSAYFDNMQLENATAPNSCNLIENGSLERGSGIAPTKWSATGLDASTDGLSGTYYQYNSKSFKIAGVPSASKELKQDIAITGVARDTYIVSGWARATAIMRDDAKYDLVATVTYAGGTTKDRATASYNSCISDWQYVSAAFTLGSGSTSSDLPVKVSVRLRYTKQDNTAYFDNIALIKDSAPTYTYDADGNLLTVSANAQNNAAMQYTNNDLTKYTDAKGYAYTYTYDTKHNMTQAKSQNGVTSNYAYVNGNPKTLDVKSPGQTLDIATSLTYTAATGGLSAGGYVSYVYDPDGVSEHYTYDQAKGLVTSASNRNNISTTYTYNANTDQMTSVSSSGATASYGYTDDRLSSVTHNGFSYHLSYDVYGNPTETKVGSQSLSKHAYTGWGGLLSSETYGNGDLVQYAYNNYGAVTSVKKGNATTTPATKYGWSYNSAGDPYKHTDYVSGLTYQYRTDSIGRAVSQRVSSTADSSTKYETQYGYDVNNNINKVVNAATGGSTYTTSYTYGQDNLPTTAGFLGTTRKIDYTHDALNRLQQTNLSLDAPLNQYYGYKLSDRNTTDQTQYRTTTLAYEFIGLRGYTYTYDSMGNLLTVREGVRANQDVNAGSGFATKISYQYDNLGQLIRENNVYTNKTTTWTYDSGGNITSRKEYAYTTGTLGAVQKTVSYTYNATWKDRLDNYGGSAITYDAIGNPLSYRGYSLGWSGGRQLATISGNKITSGSFKYDAAGLRSQKKINGVTTDYYYVGGQLLAENRGGVIYQYQYDAAGRPARISFTSSDGVATSLYLISNSRGDIEEIRNAAGNLCARYYYDATGNITSIQNASGAEITSATNIAIINPFRYRGYYYDSETGLYYLESRYYDPATGRFINADGMVQTGQEINGTNMFAYCGNDPVNNVDPSGQLFTPGEANSYYYTGNPKAPDAKLYAKIYPKQQKKANKMQQEFVGPSAASQNRIFDTIDEAAIDFVLRYNAISISSCREYDVIIVKTPDGRYTYGEPGIGPKRTGYKGSGAALYWDANIVGWVHTHGQYYGPLNDYFTSTGADYDISKNWNIPGYVGTPAGTVRKYNPFNGSDLIIFYNAPRDPRHP
ncbi:MAG: DNRLRE domain-containing protein [Coriobacteriia bacterium]|nr:DNRLRE domain-containing protein [Coriobacteriia bacterium]